MNITILAHGSRGDVQPYVALGLGLRRAGYRVRLAAPGLFRPFVEQYGLDFAPLAGDPTGLMRMAVQDAPPGGLLSPLRAGLVVLRYALPLGARILEDARAACRGADAIVHSLLLTVPGHQIAVEMAVPDFSALVFAVFAPTASFPSPLFVNFPLGPRYDKKLHRYFSGVFWWGNRLGYALLRLRHPGLPPLAGWPFDPRGGRPTPILYGFSRHVLPRPPDWGPHVHETGFWFLDSPPGWQPPPGLQAFLESGPPPVYIGFGSVVNRGARDAARMALDALARAGQRGVLLSGWGGLEAESLPRGVYPLREAPFDWLFPRVSAAVHHGGVGTTADALRAGIPSFITPFALDQPFWGRQIAKLGAGPEPVPFRELTAEALASGIQCMVEDQQVRSRASELGERIRAEDGVSAAVKTLDGYLRA